MANLLLIDDDPDLLPDQVRHVFPAPAHRVEVAHTGAEGLQRVADVRPDVILLDLRLPDQSGLDVLRQLRQIDARIPVVLVTVVRSADSAIEAMRQGAYDYLFKPLDLQKLDRVIGEALKVARLMREPAVIVGTPPDDDQPGQAIAGSCPAMQEVYKAIGRVADQTFPVLITGESGTGKELVAQAIYQHGRRADSPFLALNCAAIPETLLESELFGHEKGAFTGADGRRRGKFEQCQGGTLFLDEIGDMPLALQAKMLRVLQEQAFERVGGNETIRTDVRLIAATHRDLKVWSVEGKFRPDLYYRLGDFTIHLPPCASAATTCCCWCINSCGASAANSGARSGKRPRRRWSDCATTPGQETFGSCKAFSSKPFFWPAARSCWRPSCPSFPAAPVNQCRRTKWAQTPRWTHSSANGWHRRPAISTRKRTVRLIGFCCPACWSTPAATSTRPPGCWGSPGKPCARSSWTWACTLRTRLKPTKTTSRRAARGLTGIHHPP